MLWLFVVAVEMSAVNLHIRMREFVISVGESLIPFEGYIVKKNGI